jgi:HSP20 family molecular chaperone IbpA
MSQSATHQNGTQKERAFHKTNVLPPLDVYESAEELLVVIDVPGVTGENLTIEVIGDSIKFKAEPPSLRKGDAHALAFELGPRVFERTIKIPANIDGARISAETKNGTVVLHMPKAEAARPRRIPVKGA